MFVLLLSILVGVVLGLPPAVDEFTGSLFSLVKFSVEAKARLARLVPAPVASLFSTVLDNCDCNSCNCWVVDSLNFFLRLSITDDLPDAILPSTEMSSRDLYK